MLVGWLIHACACVQASNADELSVQQNEMLEIVGSGDSEGWVKVSVTGL